jgi:rfaE bifunctional protein nucleotidyltransferase chain/domain
MSKAVDKIVGESQALALVQAARKQGKVIVFTNGCFDLLHAGHVIYLEQARALGDFLVVGINSDDSVRVLKGPDRPVNSLQDRSRVLSGLASVDLIVPFAEPDPHRLISKLQPDVLVKGGDWKVEEIIGRDLVEARGGKVVPIRFQGGFSTTKIIQKILELNSNR